MVAVFAPSPMRAATSASRLAGGRWNRSTTVVRLPSERSSCSSRDIEHIAMQRWAKVERAQVFSSLLEHGFIAAVLLSVADVPAEGVAPSMGEVCTLGQGR